MRAKKEAKTARVSSQAVHANLHATYCGAKHMHVPLPPKEPGAGSPFSGPLARIKGFT